MSQKFNIGAILTAMLLIAITVVVAPVVTTHHIAAQLFFQGPPGQNGTQGPPGTAAQAMNLTVRNVPGSLVPITGLAKSIAACYSDGFVTGGGYNVTNGLGIVLSSAPQGNSWIVYAVNSFALGNSSVQAFAECTSTN